MYNDTFIYAIPEDRGRDMRMSFSFEIF